MLEAPITAVTVFRDGARVQRSGTVNMTQGTQAVVIGGLPASVDPASVRVAARGPGLTLLTDVPSGHDLGRRDGDAEPSPAVRVRTRDSGFGIRDSGFGC